MNDTLIQSFLSIAAEGSFSKAAEKIYISQPNLSRNIARLEKELGTKLFDRSGKRVTLTESGNIYYSAFRQMQKSMADAKARVDLLSASRTGVVRVGYVSGWDVREFFVPILGKLRTTYPEIRISMEACNTQELTSKFDSGQLDLILTLETSVNKMYDTESVVVATVPEGILFSKYLFPDGKSTCLPEDFRDQIFFVARDEKREIRADYVRRISEKYGFVPEICELNNMESVLMNVENGLGVTVCNSWIRNVYDDEFAFCSLEHLVQIAAVWKKNKENSALCTLLDVLEEMKNIGRRPTKSLQFDLSLCEAKAFPA